MRNIRVVFVCVCVFLTWLPIILSISIFFFKKKTFKGNKWKRTCLSLKRNWRSRELDRIFVICLHDAIQFSEFSGLLVRKRVKVRVSNISELTAKDCLPGAGGGRGKRGEFLWILSIYSFSVRAERILLRACIILEVLFSPKETYCPPLSGANLWLQMQGIRGKWCIAWFAGLAGSQIVETIANKANYIKDARNMRYLSRFSKILSSLEREINE